MESYCQKPMVLNCDLKEMNKLTALGCCFPTKRSKSSNSPFMGILMSFLRSTLTYQRKVKITDAILCVQCQLSSYIRTQISVIQLLTFVCLRLFFTFHHLGLSYVSYFFQPREPEKRKSKQSSHRGDIPETPIYLIHTTLQLI